MSWPEIAPPQASTTAGDVDALVLFMLGVSLVIAGGIFLCIVVFCVRYRRRPGNQIGQPASRTTPIEITWTLVPLALAMVPFVWGARLYLQGAQPPADAMEVYIVAKQWMWKAEQPGGQSEINALHVPVGRAVKLTMTSQDVIHSFYVPAFRVKADVLPGRYTTLWFQATEPGEYRLYCSQYCGTDHAAMIGQVVAMKPGDYAAWLTCGFTATNSPDGTTILADEDYLRQHILTPGRTVVSGYQNIMPSFNGLLSEDDLVQLIAYIKSIGAAPGAAGPPPPLLLPTPGPSASPAPAGGGNR